MKEWIIEAAGAANIAKGENLEDKKVLAQKIFGSNLFLSEKIARGDALIPWAALRAASKFRTLERDRGVEPLSPPWEGGIEPLN